MSKITLFTHFPSWLKPEIISGLPVRWYGLMYIVAFGVAFLLYRRQVRERRFPMTEDELSALFGWGIFALILGARLFSTLVYETSDIYRRQPWLVFWPFRNGRFTGLAGMSYHGGVIGGLTAMAVYARVKKFEFREIGDMFAASIPLGFTFGRLGNFINGELYGRVTTGPWGMVFPGAQRLSTALPAVREAADLCGISPVNGLVNLPRYPSQLYEAFFEGFFLWLVIWLLRNRKPWKGFLISLYIGGYGLIRFFIEYFREPDADLGYPVQLFPPPSPLPPALSHPAFSFSTGQLLCLGMILLAVLWLFIAPRLPDSRPVRIFTGPAPAPSGGKPEEANNTRRNRRKRQRRK